MFAAGGGPCLYPNDMIVTVKLDELAFDRVELGLSSCLADLVLIISEYKFSIPCWQIRLTSANLFDFAIIGAAERFEPDFKALAPGSILNNLVEAQIRACYTLMAIGIAEQYHRISTDTTIGLASRTTL